jgi:hypothetical protein
MGATSERYEQVIIAGETEYIRVMTWDLATMTDDELYLAFEVADEEGASLLATAIADEIQRRARITTVHEVPRWLQWLPRAFWHTKPEGEGSGKD